MSDFTSPFWGFYVGILTVVSILACGVLLFVMAKMRVQPAVPGKPVQSGEGPGTTGHVWDGDLAEYNNPLPRWWMWLFYITIVFALAYLALYPGLGMFPGVLGWTSSGAYAKDRSEADEAARPVYDKYKAMDIAQVAADGQARAMGERLFLNHCAQCHGSDAGGARGIPNLRDSDWLYGGEPETIRTSIVGGRNGIMPAFGSILGAEDTKNVVHYVRSLSGLTVDTGRAQIGKPIFLANCAVCHGANGKGNPLLGAPNLTDAIWLYGGSENTITETVVKGRGQAGTVTRMPAHKDLLDDGKVQMLTAYVWGLSNAKVTGAR
jgi:cytochrome c oxidase cbb3-type subunit 3